MAVIKIVPMPGAVGDKGDEGAPGPQGPQGQQGLQGPAGADAAWYYNGEYNPGASYVVGDVVTFEGQTWYRKHANGGNVGDTPSEGPFWDLVAAKGESADIGVHEHLANVFPNGLVVEGYISDPEVNPAGTMALSVQNGGYTALMDMVAQSAVFNGDVQITNLNGTRNTTIDTPVNVNNNLTTTEDATINNLTVGRGSGNNEFNTAVGQDALLNNTAEAFANTAIGKRSMKDNTSGNWNTAVGSHTLRSNTTGGNNVAVGNSGLEYNTTGTDNTAVGGYSSVHNTSGVHNTAIGAHSFVYNTEGIHNTVVGSSSLTNNIDGDRNTAIGADTLHNNNGSYNTAIGNAALASSTSSNYNTAVGNLSLEKNNGAANTALGDSAGRNNVNGERNIFIGYNAGLNETGSDKLYIDVSDTSTPLIHGDFATNTLTVNGTLNVSTGATGSFTIGNQTFNITNGIITSIDVNI